MKIDTMRRIDYFVGVPLCALLSLAFRLRALFQDTPRAPAPKRVLFIELSEMGSAILADPAMRTMAERHQARIFFVIFKSNRHSLQLLGTVHEADCFTLDNTNLFALAKDSWRFIGWCRQQQIDTAIDLELFSRFSALLTAFTGAARRVGFHAFHNEGLYRGEMLTHRVAYNPHQHISKNFLALVYAAAQDDDEVPYAKVHFSDDDVRLARANINAAALEEVDAAIRQAFTGSAAIPAAAALADYPVVLMNANGSDLLPQRRWPLAHFVAIIQKVLTEVPQARVLLTGSPDERHFVGGLAKQVNDPRCVNFAGGVSFAQLPALYTLSTLMLTNDSGAAHFASVTPLPTFVLFGPETPALYGALGNFHPITANLACSPCVSAWNHRKTPCQNPVCMKAIRAEDVWSRIRPYLAVGRVG